MKFYLLTGLSGAGKTAALRYMEDMGAFCVDNLPPMMMLKLMELCEGASARYPFAALGVDVRSGAFFDAMAVSRLIEEMRQLGHTVETLFLEADDETLVARYKESRRDHPLAGAHVTLTEAIALERERLAPLRETADYLLDTTGMKPRQLQKRLRTIASETGEEQEATLRIEVMSFGFKRGLPRQADLVFDVRFLPNPYYIPELCRHTGLDEDVRSYVIDNPVTQTFIGKSRDLLSFLLPHYREEGKHRLMIGIGCTGGAHRSVALTESTGRWLQEQGYQVEITHRDLALEQAHWEAGQDTEE